MTGYEEFLETIKLLCDHIEFHNSTVLCDNKTLSDFANYFHICYPKINTIKELEEALTELRIYNYRELAKHLYQLQLVT